jgi:hypothetical protein
MTTMRERGIADHEHGASEGESCEKSGLHQLFSVSCLEAT